MTNSPSIQFSLSFRTRRKVAGVIIRIFDHWNVPKRIQLELLGLSPSNYGLIRQYKLGRPFPQNPELIERASHFLNIHKYLRQQFFRYPEIESSWMMRRQPVLNDQSPVDHIRERGLKGIIEIRNRLEFGGDW